MTNPAPTPTTFPAWVQSIIEALWLGAAFVQTTLSAGIDIGLTDRELNIVTVVAGLAAVVLARLAGRVSSNTDLLQRLHLLEQENTILRSQTVRLTGPVEVVGGDVSATGPGLAPLASERTPSASSGHDDEPPPTPRPAA